MTNLQKRILTSIIIFPLSILFIIAGDEYLIFFLFSIYSLANFELFSAFKKKTTIFFLQSILIFSLFSIYYLREDTLLYALYISLIFLRRIILRSRSSFVYLGRIELLRLSSLSMSKLLALKDSSLDVA